MSEERAEAFFPLRATTTAADPKRDARAAEKLAASVGESRAAARRRRERRRSSSASDDDGGESQVRCASS